jgi:DNA-binding transcriptional regulator YdaS (Cro superfamily)
MTSNRSTKPPRQGRPGQQKHRQLIAVALLRAVSVQGASNSMAARWLGVSERTMFAWCHCERPISVETVLACRQLSDAFRRELCTEEHDHSSAYIAKRRAK